MIARYTRLFADSDGESHFEEIEAELSPADFAPPSPPLNVSEITLAAHFAFMGAPAGWQSDWHVSSARNMFVVISGGWEIEASDGSVRRFGPHAVVLVEDTRGKGHRSRVIGPTDSQTLVIQLAG